MPSRFEAPDNSKPETPHALPGHGEMDWKKRDEALHGEMRRAYGSTSPSMLRARLDPRRIKEFEAQFGPLREIIEPFSDSERPGPRRGADEEAWKAEVRYLQEQYNRALKVFKARRGEKLALEQQGLEHAEPSVFNLPGKIRKAVLDIKLTRAWEEFRKAEESVKLFAGALRQAGIVIPSGEQSFVEKQP